MSGEWRKGLAVVLVALLFALLTVGCTAIGEGIGYSYDVNHELAQPLPVNRIVQDVQRGDRVQVELNDGACLVGMVDHLTTDSLTLRFSRAPHETLCPWKVAQR